MSLEQELVKRLMDNEADKEIVLSTCKNITEDDRMNLNLNEHLIRTEIKRYELLQRYNSQDNNRRAIRKRKKAEFAELVKRRIEELKEKDSSIISYRVEKRLASRCNDGCGLRGDGSWNLRYYISITTIHIKGSSITDSYHKIEKLSDTFFYFPGTLEICPHNL